MLGKISSYPTYPIAVILKMAMHLEDPERTALVWGQTPQSRIDEREERYTSSLRLPVCASIEVHVFVVWSLEAYRCNPRIPNWLLCSSSMEV